MTWFRRLLVFVFEHKYVTLAVIILSTLFFILSVTRIHVEEDVLKLLPAEDPYVNAYSLLLTHFRHEDNVIFDVQVVNGDEAILIQTTENLVQNLKASSLFQEIFYRTDPQQMLSLLQFINRHQASLFGEAEEREFLRRLQPEVIRKNLLERKRLLYEMPMPSGPLSFSEDPLFLTGVFLERLGGFWNRFATVSIRNGYLVSSDGRHAIVLGRPSTPVASDSEFVAQVESILQESEMTGKSRIGYLATKRFRNDNAAMIKGDIHRTLAVSLIAIAGIVFLSFRRPLSSTALALLPALFGGSMATAVVALLYPSVSAIAIGCGAMLAGVVVDFGIHFLYHVESAETAVDSREKLLEISTKLFPPMTVAAGNTVAAFLLLLFSILPGYHQLGVFAAVSITGAYFFSIVILPVLASLRKPERDRPALRLRRMIPPVFAWVRRRETVIRVTGLVFLVICIAGIPRMKLEGDIQKLNGITEVTRNDWQSIVRSFGDINDISTAIVEGRDLESAMVANDRVMAVLERLRTQGIVSEYVSLSGIIPSDQRQAQNRSRWRAFWNPQRMKSFRDNLESACLEMRMNCRAFDPYLDSLKVEEEYIALSEVRETLPQSIAGTRIVTEEGRTLILNEFRLKKDEFYDVAFAAIHDMAPRALVFDGDAFVRHIQVLTLREFWKLGFLTLLMVVVIFRIYARNFREVLRLLLPLLASLLCTLGIMGWLNIPFNVLNCIILIFIFGLIDDYCVFLHSAFRESSWEGEIPVATGGAIVLSAATTLASIGSLALARHPSLHSIGITSALAIATGIAAVVFSLPWLSRSQKIPRKTRRV